MISSSSISVKHKANSEEGINKLNNYIEKNRPGSIFMAREGDVKIEGTNAHLSEGIFFGMAKYSFYLGQSVKIKNNFKVGIEYKDTGLLATGPSVYIFNLDKPGETNEEDEYWDCIGQQIGKTSTYKWKWFDVSGADNYVRSWCVGQILIKIDSDGNDDTLIKNVCVKYEIEKEPTIEYDPFIGFMEINPGSVIDIPPYSNYEINVIPNPSFDGQKITVPHNGEKIFLISGDAVTEDAPTFPVVERWLFKHIVGPTDYWDDTGVLYDDQPDDQAGSYWFYTEKLVKKSLDQFKDGEHSFHVSMKCIFNKYLYDLESGDLLLLDSYYRKEDVGDFTLNIVNNYPDKPIIEGPKTVKPEESNNFNATATDSDNDSIQYGWDWNNDDEVDEWTKNFNSGEVCVKKKNWAEDGDYTFKVKVRDTFFSENYYESEWSDPFTVTVSKSKPVSKNNLLVTSMLSKILNSFRIV